MIFLAIIFLSSALLLLLCVLYISNTRNKFKSFYSPRFTNFLLAHANEIMKYNQSVNDTILQWSKEAGDDIFVLFSSWRVHLHIVDTSKIKYVLCTSSILKPRQNFLNSFEGIDVLGNKSLLTEPGTDIWVKKRKSLDPYFHFSGLNNSYEQLLDISHELSCSVNIDHSTNLTKLMQKHVSFVIAQLVMNIKEKAQFFTYTDKISNIFAGLQNKFRNKNTFWIPWSFRESKMGVLKDLHEVRSYFKNHILSQNFDQVHQNSVFGAFLLTNVVSDHLLVDELINDMIMFFFAGVDTSMHTINFAFYELLRNEEILAATEKEIDMVII